MPERWLPGSEIQPHNTDAFVPFCYGPGVCIGKPVALYNIKYYAHDPSVSDVSKLFVVGFLRSDFCSLSKWFLPNPLTVQSLIPLGR